MGISAGVGQHVGSLSERLKAASSGTELICCSYADTMATVAYWRDRVLLAQFETTSPGQRSGQKPDILEEPMRRVGPTAMTWPRPPAPQMPREAGGHASGSASGRQREVRTWSVAQADQSLSARGAPPGAVGVQGPWGSCWMASQNFSLFRTRLLW
ncbi:DUF6461 domain-containing protein [Streptomyces rimosus]|uniref:DUF6461 domain-containing protein n=1 Tax=Streptomyces rimosus TaxID=1927 RepID=UPI0033C3A393